MVHSFQIGGPHVYRWIGHQNTKIQAVAHILCRATLSLCISRMKVFGHRTRPVQWFEIFQVVWTRTLTFRLRQT
jgi:hypothetical protein